MSSVRLSVCIIACNEERDLPRCLASVAFADEIVVVVDDRSSDSTGKLALEAGARVEHHRYAGNVEQKNVALELATGEWILSLDADEAVTPALAERIRTVLEREEPGAVGFEVNRITWHLGRWIHHGEFYPDWQLRLFERSAGRWKARTRMGGWRWQGPSRGSRASSSTTATVTSPIRSSASRTSAGSRPRATARQDGPCGWCATWCSVRRSASCARIS